ncbi:hypothetical protein HHX47_DHR3000344 [Lentinula edodes]|nr:hypothetical protein HHX47_DHR3000344 [Lentinula edodes]
MDDSFGTAFAIDVSGKISGFLIRSSKYLKPSQIPNDSVVLTSNALGQPIVMSKDRLLNAIPSSAPLRQVCEACGKFPGEKDFAICSACKGSKYCSAPRVRWPEHKPICIQMRQINEEAAKASSEGREYLNPYTLKQWYRKNNNAVEYAEERLEMAVRNRMMVLLLMDKKNPVPTILEFHQIPDKDWVKPDEHWFWQVKMYKSNLT